MKKTLFLAAIISIASWQLSAPKAQQADAVFKLLRQEWTVNADGTSDYHYRHEVQILRNRALVAYADKGETFVVYNPDVEELTVNEVYTVQKDGTRIDMPQNAFVYQLPSQCADCGRFNHIRELAMVHTGMELGCTIVVDYTIHRNYNLVARTVELMRECPIERLEVKVTVPAGQELNVQLNDPKVVDFQPTVSQSTTSYSLTASGVPQTFVDSYLPARDQLYPTLRFYNGIPDFLPTFDNPKFADAADAVGKVMGRGDARERLVNIRNFVVDNIHLNDLPAEMLGYTHATPAEVWQTGCGTATDKAVLLAAILNDEGFQARVAGSAGDEVGVTIDTLEYRLDVRSKSPLTLYGEAKDEVVRQELNGTFEAELDTLEDGFFHLRLPAFAGEPSIDASRLALTRTAPLQGVACDLASDITITLPKGMKAVGHNSTQTMAFDGIGSLEISLKQSGKKLRIVRNLKLEKSLVPPAEYEGYRKLLAAWQSFGPVLLQQK